MASEFLKGLTVRMLPKIILETLMENKIHGYALMVLIKQKYGVYHGPSTVYPMLSQMESNGLIKSEWQIPLASKNGHVGGMPSNYRDSLRPIKVYTITLKGQSLLQQMNLDIKMVFNEIVMKNV